MKVKDYLVLKDIENFLEDLRDEKLRENNGYSNNPIENIERLMFNLRKILNKLENED